MSARQLVIVESPAKAKTINKYLGDDFIVLASFGHVRDLPPKDGSVKPDENFAMSWVEGDRAGKALAEINKAAKQAEKIYLATDPDREGEAISWHLQDILANKSWFKDKVVKRVTFNEITKTAVQAAFKQARDVDQDLVDSYFARRALDYLVGFTLSPILWRKLPGSRSAGRVQSVALRLICERESEIERFNPIEYWSLNALFKTSNGAVFPARLNQWQGKKLDKLSINNQAMAHEMLAALQGQDYVVGHVERKQVKRHPSAPFITSTLQQEAAHKLGFGASRTMKLAQRLYEGVDIGGETVGLITYMRTDGITLSADAISSCRNFIGKNFAKDYLPESPRQYQSRAKNAQEAHEAIRPTDMFRDPASMKHYLDEDLLKLYTLIWQRTLACQMASATLDQVGVDIVPKNKAGQFRASGATVVFDGFLALYQETEDDDKEIDPDKADLRLPPLQDGQDLGLNKLDPNQHFTQPPPRYSEASLVKRLEELGIGRPSTYASIIQVLQERNYVRIDKKRFLPEDRGRVVTSFLANFFGKYVAYDFTADLEEQLDNIAEGTAQWQQVMQKFWVDFSGKVNETKELRITEVIDTLNQELAVLLFPDRGDGKNPRQCPNCDDGQLSLKLGKFGSFVGCSNYPTCRFTRPLDAEVQAQQLDENGNVIENANADRELGVDPETQKPIYARLGRFGPYVQLGDEEKPPEPEPQPEPEINPKTGKPKRVVKPKKVAAPKPKRASLPKGLTIATISLEKALELLALPRFVGNHPEDNGVIEANLGRFGPYLKYNAKFYSLPKDDDMLTVGMNRAVVIIAEKDAKLADPNYKPRGFAARKKAAPVKKAVAKKPAAKKAVTKKPAVKKATVKK